MTYVSMITVLYDDVVVAVVLTPLDNEDADAWSFLISTRSPP